MRAPPPDPRRSPRAPTEPGRTGHRAGKISDVAATVVTTPATLSRIALDGHPLGVAIADGDAEVTADVDAARELLASFALPPVAVA
jgi:hypothetical protein